MSNKIPRGVYAQVKDKGGKVLYDTDGGSKSETDSSSKKSGFKGAPKEGSLQTNY